MSRTGSPANAKVAAKAVDKPAKVTVVTRPSFRRERALMKQGIWPVAGCDEVGRGPLAGPVVAAAVILDPDRIPKGINDSKRLTAEAREALFEEICATAFVSVAAAPPWRIDRDNILRASLWALTRAVKGLPQPPRHVFVDGRDKIAVSCECEAVIGGDGLLFSIGAASIVAKVTRDRLMCALARQYPQYGFESHMGYAVPQHLAALERHGPTPHHRRHFAPVAAAWARLEGVVSGAPELPGLDLPDSVVVVEEAAVQVA
ncbi:ribonuclease HII (RNase HII) [Afipia carboxidovorans OM5]|uniref:Ribonuclease HII n=1 Tax=Afipia carboxidovorans (strain ATCC 49405 / DSM 1227 / KCTC 32145 / OM5) TaxID=504832 RepID=B6JF09_AFIC5|nr:ribonuclease HII [Afipia carboxidovorans]ACI94080.1 ribonuclease HII (RNase HII) [Afipia carboxidovorans OM5]AEI02260.1 ribonuclease HII [Afipia carboxidovorans OM4]AEI05836.1 ribonuclease HII [Afipia carboxidovorans OM5]